MDEIKTAPHKGIQENVRVESDERQETSAMISSSALNTYCLFCASGKEQTVLLQLGKGGYNAFSPQVQAWKNTDKGLQKRARRLLPGYVFFEAERMEELDWYAVKRIPDVLRILQYSNGVYALNNADMRFVAWLKHYECMIDVSQAVRVGSSIEFVHGPLKSMNGQIIKINKNRKVVQISFSDAESMLNTVWCPFEYVEANMRI